jgi:hypothetical protein
VGRPCAIVHRQSSTVLLFADSFQPHPVSKGLAGKSYKKFYR